MVLNNGPLTLNGGTGSNGFTVQSNNGNLTVNGGGLSNTYAINGNSNSSFVINGSATGTDTTTITALNSPPSSTPAAADSYQITQPLAAAATITGNDTGGTTALEVDAGSGAATIGLTATQITGIGHGDCLQQPIEANDPRRGAGDIQCHRHWGFRQYNARWRRPGECVQGRNRNPFRSGQRPDN